MASSFNSTFYFPQEGLNYLLNLFPRNTATISGTTYIGLIGTPWATISGYVAATDAVSYTHLTLPTNREV